MADINAQQIRKIYAIGNALGIVERGNEDDDLHALVCALTGKDSVKALTYTEAQAVIADLQKRQGAAPLPRHKPKTHPERPGGATDGQQRKVWALMYQLAKADKKPSTASLGERLCGIIRKELKVDSTPQQPFTGEVENQHTAHPRYKVYAELIRKGLKTINDVPEHLVDEVRLLLGMVPVVEENGADGV